MARRIITIDEKIERAKLKVSKAKDRYDEALSELKNLMEEKKKIQSKELMDAINKSNRTYEEIMEFLSTDNR
jgi:formiminotetrahydrofolate cyclodeaminase